MSASQTFTWIKRGANRWVLRSQSGEIAAAVTRSGFTGQRSPKFKAHVMGISRNHSSIAKYGRLAWTTGHTVQSAKRAVVDYINRHSWETVGQVGGAA